MHKLFFFFKEFLIFGAFGVFFSLVIFLVCGFITIISRLEYIPLRDQRLDLNFSFYFQWKESKIGPLPSSHRLNCFCFVLYFFFPRRVCFQCIRENVTAYRICLLTRNKTKLNCTELKIEFGWNVDIFFFDCQITENVVSTWCSLSNIMYLLLKCIYESTFSTQPSKCIHIA